MGIDLKTRRAVTIANHREKGFPVERTQFPEHAGRACLAGDAALLPCRVARDDREGQRGKQREGPGKEHLQRSRDADGNPEPDSELRDTENVSLDENVQAFFEREVKPHVPDAWMKYVFSDTVKTPLLPARHGDASGVRGAARLW